ncbi:MAG: integrase arm-type DNA-binding domain-containing protein, partial [Rickettsiales bacterium]|nr:integrase arm-type DNA-binding domain-containing protein [Rickettsiales bacterium]
GFDVVRDSYSPDLQLYITANGAKTFFVRKRSRRKDVRKILGKYPDMDIDDAREMASQAAVKMKEPVPVRTGSITLKKMADNFIKNKIRRAPESKKKLERSIARLWAEILPMKLSEITPDTLSGLHLKIAMTNGKSTANRLKEAISAIFNMAIEEGYAKENPARGLEKFPESKGARRISPGEFLSLANAIEEEKGNNMRAALKMLIYGFANKSKILAMRWDDLDLNQNTWNKKPLPDAAVVLLESLPQKSKFVFPNTGGASGHLVDPKRAWQRVVSRAGVGDIKITDIYKTLRSQIKLSEGNIRNQMNDILDRLRV